MPASLTRSGPLNCRMRATSPRRVSQARRVRGQRERVGAVGMDQEGDGRHRRAAAQPAGAAGGRCPSASDTAAVSRAAASPASVPGHALAGVHEELDVAGGAGQGRSHRSHDAGFGVVERGRHAFEGAQPERGVPDDALAPGDGGPPRLELGLDQEDEVGVGGRHRAGQRGHDAAQRDEGEVGHHERAGLVGGVGRPEVLHGEGPHVGALEDRHPGVVAQRRMELPVADVHGVDVGRPVTAAGSR